MSPNFGKVCVRLQRTKANFVKFHRTFDRYWKLCAEPLFCEVIGSERGLPVVGHCARPQPDKRAHAHAHAYTCRAARAQSQRLTCNECHVTSPSRASARAGARMRRAALRLADARRQGGAARPERFFDPPSHPAQEYDPRGAQGKMP